MPKISIIVPVYNVERYLRDCLNSLINQTLSDIEIICVNDGSTDSSPRILEEYASKDSRIKVINKENSGYGASMNMGLAAAEGEYIGIVESDDFVKTTMYEELYNLAVKNNADVVKSDYYLYTTSNNQSRKIGIIKPKYTGKVFSVKDYPKILKMPPSIWSSIYRREFLNKNNIRFQESPGASFQDISFAFKTLSSAERLVFTNKTYLYYRQDNENSSVKSKGKVYAVSDEWDEVTRFLDKNPDIKAVVNDVKLYVQFNSYKWSTTRIDESFRDEFIERYHETFKKFYDDGEITRDFYKKKDNKKELNLLLKDKSGYRRYIDAIALKEEKKQNRRKLFSVRINPSRVSIVLFGKQILEIG